MMICLESSASTGAGLGNQLFRYAFARALQLDTNEPIIMYDFHRAYGSSSHAKLILPSIVPDTVNIQYVDCPQKEGHEYFQSCLPIRYRFYLIIQKIWRYAHGIYGTLSVKQLQTMLISLQPMLNFMGFYLDGPLNTIPVKRNSFPKNFHCIGHFCSASYMEKHGEQIRNELRRPELISPRNASLLDQIRSCNAVCVHMRYGDFLSDEFRNLLYVCDETYYKKAIDHACENIESPTFFVFSNDFERASAFPFPANTKVIFIGKENSAIEDLQLMAQCNHFIIPNSTMSWWGQFLSSAPGKQVYAPSRWLRTDDPQTPCGLYMPDWTIVDTPLPPL